MSDPFIAIANEHQLTKPPIGPYHNAIKVSELINVLKNDIEQKHRYVKVVGELSTFKLWRSGHCYFDIKDELSILPAIMFKPHVARLSFEPKDGMEILFCGRVSVYTAQAKLQMCVESMEPLGQGALALAFLQLKERLKNEELFEAKYKKTIPGFAHTVGIITSSHGAVLRDMVRILKARMPKVNILFVNVRVQGQGASLEIKQAIELLDLSQACDVIILGRGGGSLQDLWPFNEEVVARAIFNAQIPIVSAVGHETDFTISDFVADIRAATPTHAATMVVPDFNDLIININKSLSHLFLRHEGHLKDAFLLLSIQKRRLKEPKILIYKYSQDVDLIFMRFKDIKTALINKYKKQVGNTKERLYNLAPLKQLRLRKESLFNAKTNLLRLSPKQKLVSHKENLRQKQHLLQEKFTGILQAQQNYLSSSLGRLEALSPKKVLLRGYSLVYNDQGDILYHSGDFYLGQNIVIKTADGFIKAKVYDADFNE